MLRSWTARCSTQLESVVDVDLAEEHHGNTSSHVLNVQPLLPIFCLFVPRTHSPTLSLALAIAGQALRSSIDVQNKTNEVRKG